MLLGKENESVFVWNYSKLLDDYPNRLQTGNFDVQFIFVLFYFVADDWLLNSLRNWHSKNYPKTAANNIWLFLRRSEEIYHIFCESRGLIWVAEKLFRNKTTKQTSFWTWEMFRMLGKISIMNNFFTISSPKKINIYIYISVKTFFSQTITIFHTESIRFLLQRNQFNFTNNALQQRPTTI